MHEALSKYARKLPIGLLFATLTLTAAVPVFGAGGCAETVPMAAGERLQEWVDEPGQSICYRLDVEPGVLLFAAQTPLVAPAEPKVRLRGQTGDGNAAALAVPPTPAQLVLRIREPAALLFEVAPQDPETALGAHTVISRFVAEADAEVFDPFPIQKSLASKNLTELDPINLKPAPGNACGESLVIQAHRSGLVLFGSSTRVVHDGDELQIGVGSNGASTLRFYDLCPSDAARGAAQLSVCAGSVEPGERVHGKLVDGWLADRDIFTFVLTEQRAVWIETQSGFDVAGALYDHLGRQLDFDGADAGPITGGFRYVKTLVPGRYFIRVESRDGTPATYSLSFAMSAW